MLGTYVMRFRPRANLFVDFVFTAPRRVEEAVSFRLEPEEETVTSMMVDELQTYE